MRRAERLLLLLLRLVRPTLDISLTIFLVCCSIGGVLKYGGVGRVTSPEAVSLFTTWYTV